MSFEDKVGTFEGIERNPNISDKNTFLLEVVSITDVAYRNMGGAYKCVFLIHESTDPDMPPGTRMDQLFDKRHEAAAAEFSRLLARLYGLPDEEAKKQAAASWRQVATGATQANAMKGWFVRAAGVGKLTKARQQWIVTAQWVIFADPEGAHVKMSAAKQAIRQRTKLDTGACLDLNSLTGERDVFLPNKISTQQQRPVAPVYQAPAATPQTVQQFAGMPQMMMAPPAQQQQQQYQAPQGFPQGFPQAPQQQVASIQPFQLPPMPAAPVSYQPLAVIPPLAAPPAPPSIKTENWVPHPENAAFEYNTLDLSQSPRPRR